MPNNPQIHTIETAPFAENTYVVWPDQGSQAVVIDPGLEPDRIIAFLKKQNKTVSAILNTHGHVDHIGGNAALKEQFPDAPIVIGTVDAVMLEDPMQNLSGLFGFHITSPPADRLVNEGDTVTYADMTFEIVDVPGHSPGHVAFILRSEKVIVFGGDVLMQGSIGRTDFPGGSMKDLTKSIREKFYTLPDDSVVYPGHGPETTVGVEKRSNPFIRGIE